RSFVDIWFVHTRSDECRCRRATNTRAAMDEQRRRSLPSAKKNQQLVNVGWPRQNLAGREPMNIMKLQTQVALPECRAELGKLEVWIEQTDHALRRMRSDHLFDLGERTHDDLHVGFCMRSIAIRSH